MNIVVTGASKGIGNAVVKSLCVQKKVENIVVIARSLDQLKLLKSDCSLLNPDVNIFPLCIDLSDSSSIMAITNQISTIIPSVEIMINNAGKTLLKPFETISDSEMRSIFNINFFGVIKLVQRLLPLLKKGSSAHIVNIGSMGGFQGSAKFKGLSLYSSSKAALANLSECLAVELKEYSIAVNCLALGAVNTAMLKKAFPNYQVPDNLEEIASFITKFSMYGHKVINGKVLPVELIGI